MGYSCCREKALKIMEKLQLKAIQPKSFKPRTTDSRHGFGYSPNLLLGGVELSRYNEVWVGDITYIGLASGFAYMSMLMDLYSRKIVGWSIDLKMTDSLVIALLRQAIASRQPSPGLVHHTDRGGQYASKEYRKLLARARMQQSMSRAGDCYDNAFMESCFGTIKTELEMTEYNSIEQVGHEIREFVNYYNSSSVCAFVLEVGKIEVLLFRVWSRGASATVPAGLIAYDTDLVGIEVAAVQNPGTIRQRMAGRYLSCFNYDPQGLGTDT
jgi:putative transposase